MSLLPHFIRLGRPDGLYVASYNSRHFGLANSTSKAVSGALAGMDWQCFRHTREMFNEALYEALEVSWR